MKWANLIKIFDLPEEIVCGGCDEMIRTHWNSYGFDLVDDTNKVIELLNYCNECETSNYFEVVFVATAVFTGKTRIEEG